VGREFVDLFDGWAKSYDKTVSGEDIEYREVFENYDHILDAVVQNTVGPNVIEFGVGTGNLTRKLINEGYNVYGVEPSMEMLKIGQIKVPEAKIQDGDFINFQQPTEPIHSIVSSYAFHHLKDVEKDEAIAKYSNLLPKGGKVVFADTSFQDKKAKHKIIQAAIASYHNNLADDLTEEYYAEIPTLRSICEKHGFEVNFQQKNKYVWVMTATKQ